VPQPEGARLLDAHRGGMHTALITGASRGLGRALADSLVTDSWRVVVDARSATDLHAAAAGWPDATAIPGDLTDEAHRHELAAAIGGRLDLLVLNASSLGQTPLPALAGYQADELRAVFETNTVAPLLLIQLALPALRVTGGAPAGDQQ
jgi:NAD(P)-dependent dehydrogenase (short-subunit alcohol dehydrogenase family)